MHHCRKLQPSKSLRTISHLREMDYQLTSIDKNIGVSVAVNVV